MTAKKMQQNLTAAGYDCGAPDGIIGRRTIAALMAYAGRRKINQRIEDIATQLNADFTAYDTRYRLEMIHFIAQACHESGGWLYLNEIWGPTAAQKRYEGRKDLGNVQQGDGYRYRGRGIFQLTGRDNYRRYGAALGVDLEADPDLASQPALSATIACEYWKRANIKPKARADNIVAVTKAINGGTNGLKDRTEITHRLKAIWPE